MTRRDNRGFTLMELLIVVAIIAVLVAVAIPVFTGQLKRAREAVDLSSVRSAKAVAAAEYMTSGAGGGATYYYDAARGAAVSSPAGIAGYGKSDEALEGHEAEGVPKDAYVQVTVAADGTMTCAWVGGQGGQGTQGGGDAPAQPGKVSNNPFYGGASSGYETLSQFSSHSSWHSSKYSYQSGEYFVHDGKMYIFSLPAERYRTNVNTYSNVTDFLNDASNKQKFTVLLPDTPVIDASDLKEGVTIPRGTVIKSSGRYHSYYVAIEDITSTTAPTQSGNGWAGIG